MNLPGSVQPNLLGVPREKLTDRQKNRRITKYGVEQVVVAALIDVPDVNSMDQYIINEGLNSRTEFVKRAVREFLKRHAKGDSK